MLAADLSPPSALRWCLAAVWDWALILAALAVAIVSQHPAVYVLAVLVIGNRQHALSILGHDGGHRLVCRKRWLNDALTNLLAFWPMMVGIHAYRKFHFAHHRLTGEADDPELALKGRAAPRYDLPAPRPRLLRRFVFDLLGGGADEVLDLALYIRPLTWSDRLGPIAWWLVVGGACVAAGFWQAPAVWFVALVTSYWATFRLRIWTEHMGTTGTHRIHVAWWQRVLFAPHNTWYHYEHHRWPAVPFYRLPAARSLDRDEPVVSLTEVLHGYAAATATHSGQAVALEPQPATAQAEAACAAAS